MSATNVLSVIRQEAQTAMLADLGFQPPPPIQAPGMPFDSDAEAARHLTRVAFDAMPFFTDGVAHVRTAIGSEQRTDFVVPARALRMNEHGHLVCPGHAVPWNLAGYNADADGTAGLAQEPRGLYMLLARFSGEVFSRSWATMRRLSPAVRAQAFNDLMARRGHLIPKRKEQDAPLVRLRTRVGPSGHRAVYAVVSDSYAAYDADYFLGDVGTRVKALDQTARGLVFYDPVSTRVRFDAFFHEAHVIDAGAGDVFRVGVSGVTRDDAASRFYLWASAHRALHPTVFNLSVERSYLLERVHRGRTAKMVGEIAAAVDGAASVFAKFITAWGRIASGSETTGGHIAGVPLFGEVYQTVPDALVALVEQGRVDLGLGSKAATTMALMASWGACGAGHKATDVIGALGHAASCVTVADVADVAEVSASAVLYDWAADFAG